MGVDHSKPPCEECGSYDAQRHGPECSKQTPEQAAARWKECYYELHRRFNENRASYTRAVEKITFWQGKFQMVKHENNALRRKLAARKETEAAVREALVSKGKLDAIRLYRHRTGAELKDAKLYVERLQR